MIWQPLILLALLRGALAQSYEELSARDNVCQSGIYGELSPILVQYSIAVAFCEVTFPVKCPKKKRAEDIAHEKRATPSPITSSATTTKSTTKMTTTKSSSPTTKLMTTKSTTTTMKVTTSNSGTTTTSKDKSTISGNPRESAWSKCRTQPGNVISTMCSCIQPAPKCTTSTTKATTTTNPTTTSSTTKSTTTTTKESTTTSSTTTSTTTESTTTSTASTTSPTTTTTTTSSTTTTTTETTTTSSTTTTTTTTTTTSASPTSTGECPLPFDCATQAGNPSKCAGSGGQCICWKGDNGLGFCSNGNLAYSDVPDDDGSGYVTCTSDASCPSGYKCSHDTCFGNVCMQYPESFCYSSSRLFQRSAAELIGIPNPGLFEH